MIGNKKGQFYLLTAIIFISMMFMLTRTNLTLTKSYSDTVNLKDLYENEAYTIINNAIYDKKNATQELEDFTDKFIDYYYQEKNKIIGIIYLYKGQNGLIISNRIEETINIMPQDINVSFGEVKTANFTSNTTIITINSIEYTKTWDYKPTQFRSIVIEEETI